MANLFLRLSSSFACVVVKLVTGRKMETVFADIVGGVHFEGARIGFLFKYKQKTKKDEPKKTKRYLRLSSSFRVRLSSFFCLHFNKKPILAPSKWTCPTMWANTVLFSFFPSSLSWTQAKDDESRRMRFAIPTVIYRSTDTDSIVRLHRPTQSVDTNL